MLTLLLRHRFSIAAVLAIGSAILLPIYLWTAEGWTWWTCGLVGLGCLLFVPLLWGILLGIIEMCAR
jgi:hypothetical protein